MNFNQVSFLKCDKQSIPIDEKLKDLILLDSASTMCLFKNKKLASHLQTAKVPLCLSTNNGMNVTRNEGKFDELSVCFNENVIASVLSYGLLADHGKVVGDSEHHSPTLCHCKASGWTEFEKLGCRLRAFDATNPKTSEPELLDCFLV